MARIQNGEISAYEVLVNRYHKKLWNAAKRIVVNEQDATEVVQDSLFSVYKNITKIDTNKKFSAFAFTITKNMAISYLRKNSRHRAEELQETTVSYDADHLGKIVQDEGDGRVRRAVLRLKKEYKKVVKLYYFDELSYGEIAKKLAVPLNTVRTYLHRAKNLLRRELRDDQKKQTK